MKTSQIFGSTAYIEDFDGYFVIIAGQSNGTDRFTISGNLPANLQGAQANSYVFNKSTITFSDTGSWVNMNAGVNTQMGTPQTGMFGISVVLANRLYGTYNKTAYVVPTGVAGTWIANDVTPSWNTSHIGEYYKKMIENANQAYIKIRSTKKLKPVLVWVHGEADSDTTTHGLAYQANITSLFNQARIDTGFINMPVIITRIRSDYGGANLGLSDVISAQLNMPSSVSNLSLYNTNTSATPLSSDNIHYNPTSVSFSGTQSAINLGNAVGDLINSSVRPIYQGQYWKQGTTTAVIDSEANALLSAMGTDPGPVNEPAIQSFFVNYKAQSGITSLTQQFGFLSVLAAHDSHAGLLWWNDPTKLMTLGGTPPSFVANRGFKNSGNGWIDTLFNPTTGTNFSLNDCAGFVYVRENIAEETTDMGLFISSTVSIRCQSRSSSNKVNTTINQLSSLSINNTDSRGLWHWRRNANNYMEVYKNGCFIGGGTNVSVSLINGNISILAMNNIITGHTQFSTKQVAAAGVCNYSVNPLIFYNNLQTYMTAVGANV